MRKLVFSTPVNDGTQLHGELVVRYQGSHKVVTITQVMYVQAYHSTHKADVTYFIRKFAPVQWQRLTEMARNNFVNTQVHDN